MALSNQVILSIPMTIIAGSVVKPNQYEKSNFLLTPQQIKPLNPSTFSYKKEDLKIIGQTSGRSLNSNIRHMTE